MAIYRNTGAIFCCKHGHITEHVSSRVGMASYFVVNLLFVLLWVFLRKLSTSLTLGVCACTVSGQVLFDPHSCC